MAKSNAVFSSLDSINNVLPATVEQFLKEIETFTQDSKDSDLPTYAHHENAFFDTLPKSLSHKEKVSAYVAKYPMGMLNNASVAPVTKITTLQGLPKTRIASKAATLFKFSELFCIESLKLGFDDEVIRQALSGRICHQFVKQSAVVGMIVPTGKDAFNAWSSGTIASTKGPFTAVGKSIQYCTALALIRETLGLSAVTMGAWSAPKIKKVAKLPKITAPSKGVVVTPTAPPTATTATTPPTPPTATTATTPPDMTPYLTTSVCIDTAVASIIDNLDALTMAQLEILQAAITEAMAKIATF